MSAGLEMNRELLLAVIADGFDGTTFHCFFALGFFVGSRWLFENKRVTAVVVAREIGRRGFAAQITIDALIIDVIFSSYVFWIFICDVSHKICVEAAIYVPMFSYFKCLFIDRIKTH